MTEYQNFLHAKQGYNTAKIFKNGVKYKDYNSGKWFTIEAVKTDSLEALYLALSARQDKSCVFVHGEPIMQPTGPIRRALNEEFPGENVLRDRPSNIYMIDVDGFEGTVAEFIEELPPPFHGCGYILQYSASQNIKEGLRAHLWFWLDKPLDCSQKRKIAETINSDAGRRIIDPAPLVPNAAVYVTPPVFLDDNHNQLPDIMPERLKLIPGPAVDAQILYKRYSYRRQRTKPHWPQKPVQNNNGQWDYIGVNDSYYEPLRNFIFKLVAHGLDADQVHDIAHSRFLAKASPEKFQEHAHKIPTLIEGAVKRLGGING